MKIDGWTDISTEEFREYRFPDEQTVRIEKPLKLKVSRSGGHRIVAEGGNFYVPPGWLVMHFVGDWVA